MHRQQLALLAQTRLPAFEQQVTDVQQLQQPGIGQWLDPTTQMQGLAAQTVKVQVKQLPLPICGCALDGEAAVR
ncbi:hypothetical protein D3C76_1601760 [compost metagenome]